MSINPLSDRDKAQPKRTTNMDNLVSKQIPFDDPIYDTAFISVTNEPQNAPRPRQKKRAKATPAKVAPKNDKQASAPYNDSRHSEIGIRGRKSPHSYKTFEKSSDS